MSLGVQHCGAGTVVGVMATKVARGGAVGLPLVCAAAEGDSGSMPPSIAALRATAVATTSHVRLVVTDV